MTRGSKHDYSIILWTYVTQQRKGVSADGVGWQVEQRYNGQRWYARISVICVGAGGIDWRLCVRGSRLYSYIWRGLSKDVFTAGDFFTCLLLPERPMC